MSSTIKKEKVSILKKLNMYRLGIFEFKYWRELLIENPNYLLQRDSEFSSLTSGILENEEYQRRKTYEHHAGDLSYYNHILQVSSLSYIMAKKIRL